MVNPQKYLLLTPVYGCKSSPNTDFIVGTNTAIRGVSHAAAG